MTSDGQLVYRLNGARAQSPRGLHRNTRPAARSPGWVLVERFVDTDAQPLAAVARGSDPLSGSVGHAIDGSVRVSTHPLGRVTVLGRVFPGVE